MHLRQLEKSKRLRSQKNFICLFGVCQLNAVSRLGGSTRSMMSRAVLGEDNQEWWSLCRRRMKSKVLVKTSSVLLKLYAINCKEIVFLFNSTFDRQR